MQMIVIQLRETNSGGVFFPLWFCLLVSALYFTTILHCTVLYMRIVPASAENKRYINISQSLMPVALCQSPAIYDIYLRKDKVCMFLVIHEANTRKRQTHFQCFLE